MPSRRDQIHPKGLRIGIAYFVSDLFQHALGFAGLMYVGSECDAKIQ